MDLVFLAIYNIPLSQINFDIRKAECKSCHLEISWQDNTFLTFLADNLYWYDVSSEQVSKVDNKKGATTDTILMPST